MVGIKFCPQCGSDDVGFSTGGITGQEICNECGFLGIFPEKEIIEDSEDNFDLADELDNDQKIFKTEKSGRNLGKRKTKKGGKK